MRKIRLLTLLVIWAFLMPGIKSEAQQVFELNTNNSTMVIVGTSSLHDWEMEATDFTTSTTLMIEDEWVTMVQNINFEAQVKDLSSDKRIMDKYAHKALKKDDYPLIKFTLKAAKEVTKEKNVSIPGVLTIAGESKEIEVACTYHFLSAQQLMVSGKTSLNMSDFGIDPPTAMLGTLKTDDAITIEFKLEFMLDSRSSVELIQ